MCPSTEEWMKKMQDKHSHTQWCMTQHPSPCLRLSFKETQTKTYIHFVFICHVASHIHSAVLDVPQFL